MCQYKGKYIIILNILWDKVYFIVIQSHATYRKVTLAAWADNGFIYLNLLLKDQINVYVLLEDLKEMVFYQTGIIRSLHNKTCKTIAEEKNPFIEIEANLKGV